MLESKMKKTKKELDELTKAVLQYKRRHNNQLIQFISDKSENLIYPVMQYYHMNYFSKLIQEDIVEECKTIVLLRAIKDFDKNKNTRFSTHYVWKLKSYIHGKQIFYLRRKKRKGMLKEVSLNKSYNGDGKDSLENILIIPNDNMNWMLEDLKSLMGRKKYKLIRLKNEGYNNREIQKKLKLSNYYIRKEMSKAREKIDKYLNNI